MNKFKVIFNFEFKTMMLKKTVLVTTILLTVVAFGITFLPRLLNSDTVDNELVEMFDSKIGVYLEDETLLETFKNYGLEQNIELYSSAETLKKALEVGEIEGGFVMKSLSRYQYYTVDSSQFNISQQTMESILSQIIIDQNLIKEGINPAKVQEASQVSFDSEHIVMGKDSTQGMIFGFIFIFAMYMLILLEGTSVSTSVAREKDSRTMELLITSSDPKYFIVGKVFAAGLVGLVQVGSIILGVVLGYLLNSSAYPEFITNMVQATITPLTLVVFMLFAITGYILYLFIYAALGSLVSKVEDVGTAVAPVTFLFVIAYLLASVAMQLPDLSFVRISSYIPFFSVFTMPIRFMLSTVQMWEVLISVGIIVLTTFLIAYISISIYRFGSLNYGNKLRLRDVFKSMKPRS